MNKQAFDDEHFEGLPSGLIFFLGELSNKVDHISTVLEQMRQSDKDMEARLRDTINKESQSLKAEKDKEIEILHKRIESSRNRLIGWFTGISTLVAAIAAIAATIWGK